MAWSHGLIYAFSRYCCWKRQSCIPWLVLFLAPCLYLWWHRHPCVSMVSWVEAPQNNNAVQLEEFLWLWAPHSCAKAYAGARRGECMLRDKPLDFKETVAFHNPDLGRLNVYSPSDEPCFPGIPSWIPDLDPALEEVRSGSSLGREPLREDVLAFDAGEVWESEFQAAASQYPERRSCFKCKVRP